MAERYQIAGKFFMLAAIQSAFGTPATPVANQVILADELSITVESDSIVRQFDRPFDGAFPVIKANARFKITGTLEAAPSGTAGTAPAIDAMYLMTSHASTITVSDVTYQPISSGDKFGTIYFYAPDPNNPSNMQRFVAVDASGTFGEATKKIGEFAKIPFELTATYADPTSVANVTPDYSGYQDPIAITEATWEVIYDTGPLGAAPSAGKYRINAREFSFTQAKQTVYVEGSERKGAVPGARTDTAISLTVFDPGSAKNLWAIAASNATNYAMRSTLAPVSSPGGKTFIIECPAVQPNFPEFAVVSEMQGLSFDSIVLPTGSGNNDYKHIYA